MAEPVASCLCERMRDALRRAIVRRAGALLQRLSVACVRKRIRIETSSRSYYAVQLILSAIASASEKGRTQPVDLSARVNGRSLTLHLAPTASPPLPDRQGTRTAGGALRRTPEMSER